MRVLEIVDEVGVGVGNGDGGGGNAGEVEDAGCEGVDGEPGLGLVQSRERVEREGRADDERDCLGVVPQAQFPVADNLADA